MSKLIGNAKPLKEVPSLVASFRSPKRGFSAWERGAYRDKNNSPYIKGLMDRLDFVLQQMSLSPSMEALIACCPHILKLKFQFAAAAAEENTLADYANSLVTFYLDLITKQHKGCNFEIASHEIRHGVHDRKGVLQAYSFSPYEAIALQRAYEADSRVFAMTATAELALLYGCQEARGILENSDNVVWDFWQKCRENPDSLWDGYAQAVAFNSFFESDNFAIFTSYDLHVLGGLKDNLDDGFYPSRSGEEDFHRIASRLFTMPYKDDESDFLQQRPYYDRLVDEIDIPYFLRYLDDDVRAEAQALEYQIEAASAFEYN